MHHAASPDGPWLPATTSPGGCGMPSAAFHPNGTLFVICGNGHAITRTVSPTSTPVWEAAWSHPVPAPHDICVTFVCRNLCVRNLRVYVTST
jgi:hypothetical protein